jgi:hypothetical protein
MVDIFSSLSTTLAYNVLLREAVDLLTAGRSDWHGWQKPGGFSGKGI